tara:strand:+ start:3242 stop:3496 length:255 start_codon:yes stop_codon:yes gene_type:complete
MTQISQQPATLTFNGKDYVIQELPPEAQSCLVYMQEIDEEVKQLNRQLLKQQLARQGFEGLLGEYIKAQEDAVKEQEDNKKPAN